MTVARAIGSGTISFGLVSVPFKLYVAAHAAETGFNMLHEACRGRLKQQYVCPACDEVVTREHMCKGFEVQKDSYVIFTDEELKRLEAAKSDTLDIVEFVPEASIDLVSIERSYYLGPGKGGDKAYALFARAMLEEKMVAVGRHWTHGKEQLVIVRPDEGGLLLMHYAFYASELRSPEGIAPGKQEFKAIELELARKFVSQLGKKRFDPKKYRDEYQDRLRAAVDLKVAGQEIQISDEPSKPIITDLFEALKRSLQPHQ